MTEQVNKEVEEIVAKYGAIREGSPELYDEIAKMVFAEDIKWDKNPDSDEFPFKAEVKSKPWRLRINDFPNEPMFTLFIEDKAIMTFDDKPDNWIIETE